MTLESHPTRPWFRWCCPCGRVGVWLERESVALRNAALHTKHHKETDQ